MSGLVQVGGEEQEDGGGGRVMGIWNRPGKGGEALHMMKGSAGWWAGGAGDVETSKVYGRILKKRGSYRRWRARTCAPPWWRAACGAPCRRWTCARSAWYEPFLLRGVGGSGGGKREMACERGRRATLNFKTQKNRPGMVL